MIDDYRKLVVWQKAMDLVEESYKITMLLPKDESFGLASQIRRAAVSIPSNIAEGQARHTKKEFLNFLSIARGSKAELDTQIQICIRLSYLTQTQAQGALALCEEVGKMIFSIMHKLD